jgi:hypothetical protein
MFIMMEFELHHVIKNKMLKYNKQLFVILFVIIDDDSNKTCNYEFIKSM